MKAVKNIIIVGGGITGLSAAYYLKKQIKAQNLPYTIKLLEASDRLGGKIRTVKQDGYTIERGPDSFLARKQPAVDLAEELGIADQLVRNGTGQAYILIHNTLRKMPQGSFMGIPLEIKPFLFSNLFSIRGKLRVSLDLLLGKGEAVADQSLGDFFRRRFGSEMVEHLMEPLLSGIYSGDLHKISLMATFPNFYELEQEHGSLIKGLRKTLPKREKPTEKRPGAFYSFKNGLGTFVTALEKELESDIVEYNIAVDQIVKYDTHYDVHLNDSRVLEADTVIMATPHDVLGNIFPTYDLFDSQREIPVSSVANVALAFDEKALLQEIDGTGFVVARNSDYRITACTWTHKKWPGAAPEGKILLRAYVGRPDDQAVVNLSDAEIIEVVLKDLRKTMDITEEPEFSVVTRWKDAMPQYMVGHKDNLANVRSNMRTELPGIFLAGSSFEGVGIPDCIDQGNIAATSALKYLREVE